ncbi:MAG: trypsin-like peptidase domain-containing protein, partial [Planctomycetota bacterium]
MTTGSGTRPFRDGRKSGIRRCRLLLALAALALPARLEAGEAKDVFKKASPSVVLIKDIEGFGSGVVLDPRGLILTNMHVVNTPLPLEVVAEVEEGGKRVTKTFQKTKVIGVHPQYDAALIQVDAASARFLPMAIAAGGAVETGDNCYAIGNPGGAEGQALSNSITTGIIGAADRPVDGLSYVQFSAAINPGNSGGALCNSAGQLVGIVTFKIDQAEGLGFAIPYAKLKDRAAFKPLVERKGDIEKCREYEKAGARYWMLARRMEGDDRTAALAMACICYRLALMEAPGNFSPYHNVGIVYSEAKEYKIAKPYLQRALELNPDSASTWKGLGTIALEDKQGDEAEKCWRKGLACKDRPENAEGRGDCAYNLAVAFMHKGRCHEAAYLARWSQATSPNPRFARAIELLMADAGKKLSDEQFAAIRRKSGDFSFADMERFAKGVGAASPKPVAVLPAATGVSAAGLVAKAKAMAAAPPPPEGQRVKAPFKMADAVLAYGGAYLVIRYDEQPVLGLFNVGQGKFEKDLEIGEMSPIFAAGGKYLVLYSPIRKSFERWNLETLRKEGERLSRVPGVVTRLSMGLAEGRTALMSYAESADALAHVHVTTLSLDTFSFDEISNQNGPLNFSRSYRDAFHLRTDDGLTMLASWTSHQSPSGFTCYWREANIWGNHYQHDSFGWLLPGATGEEIYAGDGTIRNRKCEPLVTYKNSRLMPVRGAAYYLQFQGEKSGCVRDAKSHKEIRRFEAPFEIGRSAERDSELAPDRCIWPCAASNRIVFLDAAKNEIVILPLGLPDAPA